MKKLTLFFAIVLVVANPTAKGQLFKKLKEKAQQAIESKPNKSTSNNNNNNDNGNKDAEQTNQQEAKSSNKQKPKWQPTPDCEKVFTLGEGESFMYDESTVFTSAGKLTTTFLVYSNKTYSFFMIENGQRSTEYKDADVALKKMNIKSDKEDDDNSGSSDSKEENKIEIGGSKRDAVATQYTKTISNKLYIVFNGKNYGPYDYIAKMKVSADKKKFWAVVTIGGVSDMMAKMGMGNTFLVNESGAKVKTGDETNIPMLMLCSANGGAAAVGVMNTKNQSATMTSSSGKKQELNMMDMYSSDKQMLTVADNGDIVSVPSASPTQLLVNGNEAASYKVPITNINRLFIAPTYSKSVYYEKGKIYYGDGTEEKLSGIAFPKFVTINGVTTLCYYKIHVTDTNTKDVYLCKKILQK